MAMTMAKCLINLNQPLSSPNKFKTQLTLPEIATMEVVQNLRRSLQGLLLLEQSLL
jgi:hypothetical protein